jgi:hypothetical protein
MNKGKGIAQRRIYRERAEIDRLLTERQKRI